MVSLACVTQPTSCVTASKDTKQNQKEGRQSHSRHLLGRQTMPLGSGDDLINGWQRDWGKPEREE